MDDGRYNTHFKTNPRDLITRVYVTDWPDGAMEQKEWYDANNNIAHPQEATHTLRGLLIPIAKPPMTDAEKLAIAMQALEKMSTQDETGWAQTALSKIGGAA